MSLSCIFDRLSVAEWVAIALAVPVAALLVYWAGRPVLRFVARLLGFLWDLAEVVFLLARRQFRKWFGFRRGGP